MKRKTNKTRRATKVRAKARKRREARLNHELLVRSMGECYPAR